MLRRKFEDKNIDIKSLNDVLSLLKKILNISYVLLIIMAIFAITMISKEWNFKQFLLSVLGILSPLFIGFLIAWLFNPLVTWLQKNGIRRSLGTIITYIILFTFVFVLLNAIVPLLFNQINDFINRVPGIVNFVSGSLDHIMGKFEHVDYINISRFKTELLEYVKDFGGNITENLPAFTIGIIKQAYSFIGAILIGLIIGFYLLLTFDTIGDSFIGLMPKRFQNSTRDLITLINSSMLRYVQGALIDSTCIFIITTIGLWLVGLKSPLLFGLFCGITNVIPYAGPYIGGAPAVLVGFSQGTLTGILTLLVIVIIQFIEGNFFQPYIMSKTTKLHPVTIIVGLLVFGHFWGVVGMVVSTPIIGSIKAIILFLDEKYGYFGFLDHSQE